MGWVIILLLELSIGLILEAVKWQEAGLAQGIFGLFGLAVTAVLFLIWSIIKIINKHNKSNDKNRKKPSNIEIILLGIGFIMFIYGGLFYQYVTGFWFYRYVTIVGICTTLVGCYLWTRRKKRSWALDFWEILGPLLILLGIGFMVFIYGGLFYRYVTGFWFYRYVTGLWFYLYVTIVGICTTLVGCYLWTKRENRLWALNFWEILGPLLTLLGIGFMVFIYSFWFYRYVTIVSICTTLVGCYLWTKRENETAEKSLFKQ